MVTSYGHGEDRDLDQEGGTKLEWTSSIVPDFPWRVHRCQVLRNGEEKQQEPGGGSSRLQRKKKKTCPTHCFPTQGNVYECQIKQLAQLTSKLLHRLESLYLLILRCFVFLSLSFFSCLLFFTFCS